MKKISLILILLILSGMLIIASASETATVVFEENFEGIKLNTPPEDGWEFDTYDKDLGIYAHVVADPEDSNNKVLKYVRETGGLVYANKIFEPIGGRVFIDYRFRLADTPSTVQYVGLFDGIYNLMTFQGTYEFNGAVPNMGPDPDKWHTFHIEIDFLERCFTASIDGLVVRREIPFANQDLESMDRIRFAYSDGWVMIDDLKVSYEGGIVKNYTKLDSAKYVYASDLKGIYNVPVETEVNAFLENVIFVEDAIYGVFESDGVTPWTKRFIDETAVLKVQSPDLTQESIVKIYLRPWMTSYSNMTIASKCVVLFDGSCDIMIKNKKSYIDNLNTEIKCFYENGEIYVPLRRVCEAFSKSVGYDEYTKTVTVDGKAVKYDTRNISGRTFIKADDLSKLAEIKLLVREEDVVAFCDNNTAIDSKDYTVFVNALRDRK